MLKSIFHLVRPLNQIIIVATMYLVRYFIVLPTLQVYKHYPSFNDFQFFLLVLSVVLISAGGYIINDYFDIKTDEVNKPDKIYVGRKITRRHTILLHVFFSAVGLIIALFLAYQHQNYLIALFHIVAWVLLWYYSVYFKRTLALGNIIVSILTSSVIILVYVSEYQQFKQHPGLYNAAFVFCLFYATFAFLVNLKREIIKDAEDLEGDKLINANTIPIKFGYKTTKKILNILALLSTIGIFISMIRFYWKGMVVENIYSLISILTISFVLCFYFITKVNQADRKAHFSYLSNYIKIVLFVGVISMIFLNI